MAKFIIELTDLAKEQLQNINIQLNNYRLKTNSPF
jgi:hypothetical protein